MKISHINNHYETTFTTRIKIKKPTSQELMHNGLITTGLSSTAAGNLTSAASYMDQSVHYPLLGSQQLPNWFLNFANHSALQESAYNYLYKPHALGNQTAIIPGTLASSTLNPIGLYIKHIGSKIKTNNKLNY